MSISNIVSVWIFNNILSYHIIIHILKQKSLNVLSKCPEYFQKLWIFYLLTKSDKGNSRGCYDVQHADITMIFALKVVFYFILDEQFVIGNFWWQSSLVKDLKLQYNLENNTNTSKYKRKKCYWICLKSPILQLQIKKRLSQRDNII